MSRKLSWRQQISNRLFAVPLLTQWWARRAVDRRLQESTGDGRPPFTVLHKPLAECRAVLITTAGIHLRSQQPFDMENKDGDATYREIPATTQMDELTITHDYYDHKDADRDPNVVFPLVRFRELVGLGVIGGLAPRHFGLMGHTEGEQLTRLTRRSAPDVATKLRKDGVDFAFLTPA